MLPHQDITCSLTGIGDLGRFAKGTTPPILPGFEILINF